MKKLILPLLMTITLGAYTVAYAQKMPTKSVQKAFNKKFPNAQNVKWGMENAHEYEADFMNKGQQMSANFKTNGKWVETEQDISIKALPNKIKEAINHDYPGVKLKDAAHIWNQNGQRYEIDAEVKENNMEVVYSANGKLLSHSVTKDNDEGDGD